MASVQVLTVQSPDTDANSVTANSTGIFGTVTFLDISKAGETVDFQLVFDTTGIEAATVDDSTTKVVSPIRSIPIPPVLELTLLERDGTWNNGALTLRVAGSESVSGDVNLVASDAGFTTPVTVGTGGVISDDCIHIRHLTVRPYRIQTELNSKYYC